MQWFVTLVILGSTTYALVMAYRSFRFERTLESLRACLPRSVRQANRHLAERRQAQFVDEFRLAARRPSIGWLLWLVGCHYLHVRRPVTQVLYWVTLGGFGVWAMVDLVTMPAIIRQANEQIGTEVFERVRTQTASARRYGPAARGGVVAA